MDKLAELKEQWKALRSEGNDALTEEVPVKSGASSMPSPVSAASRSLRMTGS